MDICVSDNRFSWDDLRSWLEDQYRDIGLRCVASFSICHVTPFTCNFLSVKSYFTLRWVKDARLTMASTPRHSLVGQIMVNQAITTANIAKATAAIASVAKENKNTHGWKLHVGFGLEDEVNKAVQLALTDEGYTNINALDFFKAIKGLDGKDEYNFDGVFEAIKEDDNYLFVGETKQYLEGHIVLDAEADRQKLADCLLGVRMSQSQVGARSYNSQTKQLQEYTGFTVLLYVRGCRVLPGTIENAKRVKCVIVQPSGAGMQMTIF